MIHSPRQSPLSLFARVPLFWQLQCAGWVSFAMLSFPMKLLGFGSVGSALAVTACQLPLGLALAGVAAVPVMARGAPADIAAACAPAMALLAGPWVGRRLPGRLGPWLGPLLAAVPGVVLALFLA